MLCTPSQVNFKIYRHCHLARKQIDSAAALEQIRMTAPKHIDLLNR